MHLANFLESLIFAIGVLIVYATAFLARPEPRRKLARIASTRPKRRLH
jgi:hypothetical protein